MLFYKDNFNCEVWMLQYEFIQENPGALASIYKRLKFNASKLVYMYVDNQSYIRTSLNNFHIKIVLIWYPGTNPMNQDIIISRM